MFKRILRDMDWMLLGATTALVCIGIVIIGSATHVNKGGLDLYDFVEKQGAFFVVNMIFLFLAQRGDYHVLKKWAQPIYVITILMLLAVMFLGTTVLGAQRWIAIGPVRIQPSEFSKLLMIIALANLLAPRMGKFTSFKSLLPITFFVGIPFMLVLLQPDLGTSLVFFAITAGMLFISEIDMRIVKKMCLAGLIMLPFTWFVLKDYQKQRVMVFLNPDADPYGAGYHIIQSKIAVGSGGFWGQGLFQGTQSQLNFLPENHTDFIFSVIGEEFGFLGCVIVLFFFFIVLYRGIQIARSANDGFGSLLAIGIVSMLCFQILVNVGMTTGIMPVTGIPLPFISYGVSSLTTNMMSIAILENIYMHRKTFYF